MGGFVNVGVGFFGGEDLVVVDLIVFFVIDDIC